MLGLLTAVGGAAAIELHKLRRGRGRDAQQEVDKLKAREEQLSKLVEVGCCLHTGSKSACAVHNCDRGRLWSCPLLQRITAELQQEKATKTASDERQRELESTLDGIVAEKSRLEEQRAELASERDSLKAQATVLAMQTVQLAAKGDKLSKQAEDLASANALLTQEVGPGAHDLPVPFAWGLLLDAARWSKPC